MTKKELTEVKKAITNYETSSLADISICYVNNQKEKVLTDSFSYLNLPEEETFKYLEIFKKVLSGGFNKSLFQIEMQGRNKEQNLVSTMENKDRSAFYDAVIESYNCPGNFLIVVGHGFYDYAARLSDGSLDEDSEYTYEYMVTAVCPVVLSKPGLSYVDNSITTRVLDWVVEMPKDGFLYPAFTDREANLHELLYYTKNNKERQDVFLDVIAGSERPISESEEKEWFSDAVKEGDNACDFEVMKNFYESAKQLIENNPGDVDAVVKEASEIKEMLEDAGMTEDSSKNFIQMHDSIVGEEVKVSLLNLINTDATVIKGTGFTLKLRADMLPEVKAVSLNNRNCLVIPLNSSSLVINDMETTAKILN